MMANHPNRNRTDDERLAVHVLAERNARVGYPYADRASETAWAANNLPPTKKAFDRLLVAIRATFPSIDPLEVAAVLLGTVTMYRHDGRRVLAAHGRTDLTAAWAVESAPKRAGGVCKACGKPAMYNANKGPACAAHYDDLS